MSDSEKFLIVKKHIDQMDYYALLAGGAPNDEFNGESREISTRIYFEQSVQERAGFLKYLGVLLLTLASNFAPSNYPFRTKCCPNFTQNCK